MSNLPHAMLFFGKARALELAAVILRCSPQKLTSHPDFFPVALEIDAIRKAIGSSHIAPFEAPAKVFFIESAERMQPAAANALLKTLEEPPPNTYWMLLSSKPREILPTILSRCSQRFFCTETDNASDSEELRLLRSLLSERPAYPKLSLGLEKLDKLLEGDDSQARALALFNEIALHLRGEASCEWQEPLQEALLAVQRNMKLSACLEVFFLRAFQKNANG